MIPAIGYAVQDKDSDLAPVRFERREPGPRDIRIDILYCGVCHSDLHQARNDWKNTVYPCLPGHEIIGRVAETGGAVEKVKAGDLVGVGCLVDSCRHCDSCDEGLENYCTGPNGPTFTYNGPARPNGLNTQGGYSNVVVVDERFVLRVPDALDPSRAAPILCAGITTYSPLRHWGVKPGWKVGVAGLGGLGHMAVKLATAMGAEVRVFTTSPDKADAARRSGAAGIILSKDADAMAAAAESFDLILSTIPVPFDVNPYIACLKRDATLVNVGAVQPLDQPLDAGAMVMRRKSLAGSVIGGLPETQEVLDFCAEHGIMPEVRMVRMDEINEVFAQLARGDLPYRFVIDMATLRAPRDADALPRLEA